MFIGFNAPVMPPLPCPACGGRGGVHGGACEVLVVLTARTRLRLPGGPANASGVALVTSVTLSLAWSDSWHPDAKFWREVADEIDYQLERSA